MSLFVRSIKKWRITIPKRILVVSVIVLIFSCCILAAEERRTAAGNTAAQITAAAMPVAVPGAVTTTTAGTGVNTIQNISATAETQYAVVHGKTFILGSRDWLTGVLVQVTGTALTAESGLKGRYNIHVPAGDSTLVFTAQGYSVTVKKISVKPGEDMELNAYLEKVDFTADAVVVTAQKEREQVTGSTLAQNEIKKIPGTAGDALRAVQNMPGVAAASDYSSQLVVQGGGPFDNLFLLDNIPWPQPFHFGGLVSTVNSDLLSSVVLNGAGFGAKWGNDMGSVLDAETIAGRKDRIHLTADLNMIMTQVLVEGPVGLGDASFTLAGRRTYINMLIGWYTGDIDFTALPFSWDLGGTLDFTLGPDNHFRGLALASYDTMSLIMGIDMVNEQDLAGEYGMNIYAFTSGMSWTNTSLLGITSTLTPYYYTTKEANVMGMIYNINDITSHYGLKEEAVWDTGDLLGMKNELGFGGSLEMINETTEASYFESSNNFNEIDYSDFIGTTVNSRIYERSVYLQDHIQINKQWAFVPGVRYDKRDDVAHDTLLPRLRLEYQYDDSLLWKAAWGYYSQFPTAEQMNADFGNPGLSANIAEHMVVYVEKKLSLNLSVSMDAYYKTYRDLVANITDVNGNETFNNKGFGIAKGVEFYLKDNVTDRFFCWISYALSESIRLDPETGLWHAYEYDQPNILNVVASYKINPVWSLGVKARYNSGPLENSMEDSFIDGLGIWHPVVLYNDFVRLGDYVRIDVRTDYALRFESWRINLYLEIINLLNRLNPAGVIPYNGTAGSLNNIQGIVPDGENAAIIENLPRMIYLGVELEF